MSAGPTVAVTLRFSAPSNHSFSVGLGYIIKTFLLQPTGYTRSLLPYLCFVCGFFVFFYVYMFGISVWHNLREGRQDSIFGGLSFLCISSLFFLHFYVSMFGLSVLIINWDVNVSVGFRGMPLLCIPAANFFFYFCKYANDFSPFIFIGLGYIVEKPNGTAQY